MKPRKTRSEVAAELRKQATQIRALANTPTNGGHVENILLHQIADRLDADADNWEKPEDAV